MSFARAANTLTASTRTDDVRRQSETGSQHDMQDENDTSGKDMVFCFAENAKDYGTGCQLGDRHSSSNMGDVIRPI